jgi:hypothetical protein
MAKPPMMIHVQSSDFKQLLQVQQLSLEHVQSIRTIIESGASAKHQEDSLSVAKAQLEAQQEQAEAAKQQAQELSQLRAENVKALTDMAQAVKGFESFSSKVGGMFRSLGSKFTASNLKTSALKAVNVGGFLNKKIAEREFVAQQRKLESDKSDKELRQDFDARNKAVVASQKNEAELNSLKKDTGLSEADLAKTKEGQRLLGKRESLANTFKSTDIRAQIMAKPESAGTALTNKEQNDAVNVSEEEMESARREEAQNSLLEKIEKNTAALGGNKATAASSGGAEGGILGGIGLGLKALGSGIKSLGDGAGKGIAGFLRGLASGLAALANPMALVGLAAVTIAAMGLGKALEFAAPAIEAFAPVLERVVDVIGNVFIAAIEKIPETIRAVGEVITGVIGAISDGIIGTINAITESIERLSKVDGMNLAAVGAGLLAVAGGMVAFSAANVAGGIGNLVGGLLSKVSGQKSPVEQIIALGEHGQNIEKAGIGVEKLGAGLKMFSDIKPENIKAIAALPTDKIAAMGLAMSSANVVSSQSAANDSARTAASGGGGGSNTAVNAPTTNISTTKQIVQLPVRNQEQTMNRYMRNRFA